jgi:DUF4097 and DUF4098 domain-containing protein YvlB
MMKRVNTWRCTLNERLRILKLLEEGAISAEDAARLLEALSAGHSRRKHHARIWTSLEGIPDIIATAIDSSMKFEETNTPLVFGKKQNLEFKGISGDLSIKGEQDCDGIIIDRDGYVKAKEEDKVLRVKALSGDMTITTPRTIDLSLKGISGDITLDNLEGNTSLESVSGDIKGTRLAGKLKADIVSADVDLEYTTLKDMHIRSRSGNIVIWLDDSIEAALEIHNEKGTITCEFELIDKNQTQQTLTGTIKNARAHVQIQNKSGEISIRKLSNKTIGV